MCRNITQKGRCDDVGCSFAHKKSELRPLGKLKQSKQSHYETFWKEATTELTSELKRAGPEGLDFANILPCKPPPGFHSEPDVVSPPPGLGDPMFLPTSLSIDKVAPSGHWKSVFLDINSLSSREDPVYAPMKKPSSQKPQRVSDALMAFGRPTALSDLDYDTKSNRSGLSDQETVSSAFGRGRSDTSDNATRSGSGYELDPQSPAWTRGHFFCTSGSEEEESQLAPEDQTIGGWTAAFPPGLLPNTKKDASDNIWGFRPADQLTMVSLQL